MNITADAFAFHILKCRLENHDEIKPQLLKLFEKEGGGELTLTGHESVTNQDWRSFSKTGEYWKLLSPHLTPMLKSVSDFYAAEKIEVINYWFQQYEGSDFHGWHTHPSTMLNAVYIVEASGENEGTEFHYLGEVLKTDAKEGDVVFWPSFLFHRSPEKTHKSRRSIVAFNLNFENFA